MGSFHQALRFQFSLLSFHPIPKRKMENLNRGDYQAQFGQGLVFGSGYSPGKGAEAITTVRRSSVGLRPFTSAMEFGFFRGGAATYSMGNFELTALYSNAPRDGNVQSLDRKSVV